MAKHQGNQLLLKSIERIIANYELYDSNIETLENGKLILKSPKTSYITELIIEQGDDLKADQNSMRIIDTSTLWAIFDVYETDLEKMKIENDFKVQKSNQQEVIGEIIFILHVLGEKTRSAKARIVIDNSNLVKKVSGLQPNDEIISRRAFKVDSDSQLANKLSMINRKFYQNDVN